MKFSHLLAPAVMALMAVLLVFVGAAFIRAVELFKRVYGDDDTGVKEPGEDGS